jgi:hypothetical protein
LEENSLVLKTKEASDKVKYATEIAFQVFSESFDEKKYYRNRILSRNKFRHLISLFFLSINICGALPLVPCHQSSFVSFLLYTNQLPLSQFFKP